MNKIDIAVETPQGVNPLIKI